MVAALSPADINYDETLSTLRCVLEPGGPPPAWLWDGVGASLPESGALLWGRSSCLGLLEASGGCRGHLGLHGPVPFPPPMGLQAPRTPVVPNQVFKEQRGMGVFQGSLWLQGRQPGWGAWVLALKEAAGLTGSHASNGKRRNGCGSLCRYLCTHL